MCFQWVWCCTQRASQLRQTLLHPYRSSGPVRNNGPDKNCSINAHLSNCDSGEKHCSNLTLTVRPASANSLCPVSVFDGMGPVANAGEVSAECWIMAGWGFSDCAYRSAQGQWKAAAGRWIRCAWLASAEGHQACFSVLVVPGSNMMDEWIAAITDNGTASLLEATRPPLSTHKVWTNAFYEHLHEAHSTVCRYTFCYHLWAGLKLIY